MKHVKDDVDIVIIGAGMAGLAAALECKESNYSFVVLEARNRPGGRVYSIETNEGNTIDLGAHWIGVHHSRIKSLVNQFGLKTTSTYTDGKTIYNINGRIRKRLRLPPLSPLGIIDLYNLKRKINKLVSKLPYNEPLSPSLSIELDKQTIYEFIQKNMFTSEGKEFYTMVMEEIFCSKIYEVSALDFMLCIKSTGSINYLFKAEDEWLTEGAQELPKRMAESLGPFVYYNSAVERISYLKDYAYVYTNKKVWKTKRVIIAIPPNLTTRIDFVPPLPGNRVQLCERSGMPSVTKVVIIYEMPFWRDVGLSGKVFSNQFPFIFSMDSSPPNQSKGILTVLITGENARLLGRMSDTKRKLTIINSLVKLFGHKAANPISIYEKIWSEDEWTRGGYATHYATGVLLNLEQD